MEFYVLHQTKFLRAGASDVSGRFNSFRRFARPDSIHIYLFIYLKGAEFEGLSTNTKNKLHTFN